MAHRQSMVLTMFKVQGSIPGSVHTAYLFMWVCLLLSLLGFTFFRKGVSSLCGLQMLVSVTAVLVHADQYNCDLFAFHYSLILQCVNTAFCVQSSYSYAFGGG